MVDVLAFVFASPWRFAGIVVLVLALGFALGQFRPLRITHHHGED